MTRTLKLILTTFGVGVLCVGPATSWRNLAPALPNNSQFELEGNATVEGPGDDWANTVPAPGPTSEAVAATFVADGSGNSTIFTTGGSKDVNNMDQWQWKDQLGGL